MKKFKNIVVSISLKEELLDDIKAYRDYEFLYHADNIYFVHIYNERSKDYIPLEIREKGLESVSHYVLDILHGVAKEIIPNHDNKDSDRHSKCILMNDEKVTILDYLQEVEADLVIAETRGEQGLSGLFKDSYCFWLVEHAPCDVLVLKALDK